MPAAAPVRNTIETMIHQITRLRQVLKRFGKLDFSLIATCGVKVVFSEAHVLDPRANAFEYCDSSALPRYNDTRPGW